MRRVPRASAVDILNDALELHAGRRETFITEACKNNPALLADVRSLLAEREPTGREDSPDRAGSDSFPEGGTENARESGLIGQRVGTYRILKVLGEGGMGVVYLAEQEHPRRTVALKILKSGLIGRETHRRFEREVEVLGRLQHPGIAQIFDAGTTGNDGVTTARRPFFAMEYVQGEPLTQFAKSKSLDAPARLALMARVCDAVHEAHQQGVIHRDLKPSNILVDGLGQPKVLDFGVARATDSDVAITTQHTQVGELLGTLQYMSPEQCMADPAALDTRSDIYALGVILHELLTGDPPYDLSLTPLPEAVRIITEQDPTRLGSIDKMFRGDIETIVAKAMEKDKKRRYQSAGELALDIRRWLNNEPILARPASTTYQLRKFVKRNPAFAGTAAVALTAMVVGVAWVSANRARLEVEHRFAIEAKETADQYRDLSLLVAPQAFEALNQNRMDAINAWLNEHENLRSPVEERAREVAGLSHYAHAEYDRAAVHLRRVLDINREQHGATDQATLRSINLLFNVFRDGGMLDEATVLLGDALDACDYAAGTELQHCDSVEECAMTLRWLKLRYNQAEVLHHQGRLTEAEASFRRTLHSLEQVLSAFHRLQPSILDTAVSEHHFVLEVKTSLGALLLDRGEYRESEEMLRSVMRSHQRRGDACPVTMSRLEDYLGMALLKEARLDEAERLLAGAFAKRREELGEDHPDTLWTAHHYGQALLAQGKRAEAESLLVQTIAAMEKKRPNHWRTEVCRGDHGRCLSRLGRYPEAQRYLSTALKNLQDIFGRDDYRAQEVLRSLADLHPHLSQDTTR